MLSSSSPDLILHGEELFRTGYVHEALQVFDTVLAAEPQNLLAGNNRGVILHRLGRYAEAEQTFLGMLQQDDAEANAVVNLASLYIEQCNLHQAGALLDRYGPCLSTPDIQALKAQLQQVAQALEAYQPTAKTQQLRIAMDVHDHAHAFEMYFNDQEPSHQRMCACFAGHELYHPALSRLFAQLVRARDGVIDIGAHIGYLTLLAATLVGPEGWVLACEPEEKNLRYLQENIALNGFTQVHVMPLALGLAPKTAKLFRNADDDAAHALWNVGRHPAYLQSRLQRATQDVRVEALDTMLRGVQFPGIRLIHLDTCGAELDILQGAVGTLEGQQVPYVICAMHRFGLQQMGTSEQELRHFMGYMGYTPYWIRPEAPHLVPLPPPQEAAAGDDTQVLFVHPAWAETDSVVLQV